MRTRTGYSFRTAVGHTRDVVSRIKELGWDAAPISDRNSTFGFTKWTKAAKEAGLRPIYGVELAVVPSLGEKRPFIDYWTFFAKESLRPLHDAVAQATSNPGKEPSLTYQQALALPGLVKITGERVALDLIPSRTRDLYVGLSPSLPAGLYHAALERGLRLITTADNFYPRAEDKEFYRVSLGRRANTQTYPMWMVSDEELWESVEWYASRDILDEAIANRRLAMASCSATQKRATLLSPDKPMTLRQMCVEGADRVGVNLEDKIYSERLDRELAMIASKNFEDYFYIIADLIGWAKKRMIVGPARGSSCGSLVCYLLDITTIDPIPYKLVFERFIDINRSDLPDIDIDFSDVRRQMVFDYAEEKYGTERVARLGTVGMFQPKSALNQAGATLKIPSWQINKVVESIIDRSAGDSRADNSLEDTLAGTEAGRTVAREFPEILIAGRMEGHPNNAGQHAAGIVITQEPVAEFVAVNSATKATMCDKKDAEALNLLKIDALGLTQLSIFERTMDLIGRESISGWLETIPLDDPLAFDVLNRGHFAGVFQFTGGAMRGLTQRVKITEVEDMISITALCRPGPTTSGGADQWVRRKNKEAEVTYPHPAFEPYTRDTYGVVVYQEQIMQIARNLGDLSWDDVTELRKAMSKSLGKEYFDKFGDRWKAGAMKRGIPASVLDKTWDEMCAYGAWAFNRAHSVAYGIVSYWSCWLKAHHPVEFAAATLDAEKDPAKQIAMLRELATEGIDYVAVDQEHSTERWEPVTRADGKKSLVGPLTIVKGIGPAAVAEILDCRRRGQPLRATLSKRVASAKTDIDSLFPIRDAIARLHPDIAISANIHSTPTPIINVQSGIPGEVLILALAKKLAPLNENEPSRVAKRGREFTGPVEALNMFFMDDTDEIFCKIDRYMFKAIGEDVVNRGRQGKALYAIKGTVPRDFRMIKVRQIRFLGFTDDE
jgi:DNA polymerase III alpha subunit